MPGAARITRGGGGTSPFPRRPLPAQPTSFARRLKLSPRGARGFPGGPCTTTSQSAPRNCAEPSVDPTRDREASTQRGGSAASSRLQTPAGCPNRGGVCGPSAASLPDARATPVSTPPSRHPPEPGDPPAATRAARHEVPTTQTHPWTRPRAGGAAQRRAHPAVASPVAGGARSPGSGGGGGC